MDRMADQQFGKLQTYVEQESITVKNLHRLNAWCGRGNQVYLTIYMDDAVLYDCSASAEDTLDPEEYSPAWENPEREYDLILSDDAAVQAFLYYYTGDVYYYWSLVFSGLIAFVVFSLCFIAFVHRKLRYVKRLKAELDILAGGDLDYPVTVEGEDELGELAGRFNNMVEARRRNREALVENQRELNQAQIRMLQAQLNPHFLCNTLDTMKWISKINKVPEVALMSTDLADILRFSISGEELVTLERELELIDRYLDIQLIRFEDRFTCEIDVADRLQSCLVPKLALQPLVENAIIHGVADRDDGYIKVQAVQEGDDLVLRVSDNGCGMAPEVLERLNSDDKRIPGGHLGLYNTDSIIRLRFGAAYGLTARSAPGEGSCVSLRLPIQREEAGDAEGADC